MNLLFHLEALPESRLHKTNNIQSGCSIRHVFPLVVMVLSMAQTALAQSWPQIGSTIVGDTPSENTSPFCFSQFGRAVQASASGNRLAVSSYLGGDNYCIDDPGRCEVFELVDGVWAPLGDAIVGEDSTFFNINDDMSFSSFGNTVVVKGKRRNPDYPTEYSHVAKVYDWSGSAWEQIGGELLFGVIPQSGYLDGDIKISGDGTTIAFGKSSGASSFDSLWIDQVKVVRWNGSDWQQLGNIITDTTNISGTFGGFFGTDNNSIGISQNGERIVISEISDLRGAVRVYEFSGGDWIQAGQTLRRDTNTEFYNIGLYVSISGDSDRIAVTPPEDGFGTGIYEFNGSEWTQLGAVDTSYAGVKPPSSLSSDGMRIASQIHNTDTFAIYQWDESNGWLPIGFLNQIGASYSSIALSGNGNRVAIPMPEADNYRGAVSVFEDTCCIGVSGHVYNRNFNLFTGQFGNTLIPFGSQDTLSITFTSPVEDPPVVMYSDSVNHWEYMLMDTFIVPWSYHLNYPVSSFTQRVFKQGVNSSGRRDFTVVENLYTSLSSLIFENAQLGYDLSLNDTLNIQEWLGDNVNGYPLDSISDAMARMLIQNFAINEYHTDTLFNTYLHNFAEYAAKLVSNLVNINKYKGIHEKNINGVHTLEADEIIGKIISKSMDLIVKVVGTDKVGQFVESLASNIVASEYSGYDSARRSKELKKKAIEKGLENGIAWVVENVLNAVIKVAIRESREYYANNITGVTNTTVLPVGVLPMDSVFVKTIDLNSGSDSYLYSDRNEMEFINNLYQTTTSITEGVDYVADILEATPGVTSLAVYFRGFNFVTHTATVGRFLGGLWHIFESNAAIPSIIYQDPESNQQGLQMGPITRTQLMMPDSCWASIVSDHEVSLDSLHTYAENLDTTRLLNYIPQFLESDAVFEREALNCYYPLLLDCLDVNGDTNILNIVCNLKNKLDLMDLRRFDIYTWLGMVFTSDSFNFEIIRLHIDTLYAEMDSVSLRIDTLRTSLEEYEIINGNFPNISSLHIVNKEIVRLNEYDVDVRLVITNIGDIMSDSSLIYVSADTLGMPLTDTTRTIIPIAPFDTVALSWTFAFPLLDSAEIITFKLNFVDSVALTYSDFISYKHKKLYYHYYDFDSDGYGRPDSVWLINIDTTLTGFVLLSGDCDDANPAINPGAVDIPCNEIDENCDGRDGLVRLWVGGTGMWIDSSGWSPFGIPGVCDEAQILASTDSVMIPLDYSAIAGRVLISDGAVLQLLDSSFLDLNDPDDAAALELLEGAFLDNRGTIRIGNLDTIPAGGIRVSTSAIIYNDSSGVIQVNAIYGLDHDAIVIEGSNSHLNNQGLIEIGGFTQISGHGIRILGNGTLANGSNGLIEIDSITGTGKDGITIEQNGHLINEGDIHLGSNSPVNRYGISLTALGDLMNHPSGTITIDQVQSGLYASGTGVLAKNEGEIRIGSTATVSANGILLSGLAEMINDSSAEVFIDQCLHAVSIDNQAKLTNNAGIHIGSLLPITGNGISLASGGDMVNLDSANVEINRTNQAIFATASGSTLANEGIFRIGNIASSNSGISLASSASLNNQLTGMIEIDAISINHGIQVTLSATVNNTGLIRIGTSTAINKYGISLATSGDFNNNAPGILEINKCLDVGINMTNSGTTFINAATIHLGNLSSITNTGLSLTGSAVFGNAATGLLTINRTTGYAAMVNNNLAVFNNFGTVRLGDLAPIGGGMIMWASGKFTNFANSHLEINRASWVGCLVDQSGTLFTNHGNFKIGNLDITQAGIHHKNGGDFINQATGNIEVDRMSDFAIQSSNSGSIFTNYGMITIGSMGTIANSGLLVNQNSFFSNTSTGNILINNANINWWTDAISVTGATYSNAGQIVMGNQFQNSNGISVEGGGGFTNTTTGIVQADHAAYHGIQVYQSGSVFTNHGSIVMGTIGTFGHNGILATESASFINSLTGSIQIDNVNINWYSRGILLSLSGSFNNAGSIELGTVLSNRTGIFVETGGSFTNTIDGSITINNTTNNGVQVEVAGSSFSNNGDLLIGSTGGPMEYGILVQNSALFSNSATGLVQINKASAQWWSKSIAVISAMFTNAGSIEAGNSSLVSYGLHVESSSSFTNQASGTIRVNTTTYNGLQLLNSGALFTNDGFIEIGDSSQIGHYGIALYENSSMSNSATGLIELNQGTTNWFSGALFVHKGFFTNNGHIAIGLISNVNLGLLIGNSATEMGTFANYGTIEIDRIPPTTSYAAITVRPGSSFYNEASGILKMGLNHNVQFGLYGGGTISNYGLIQTRHIIYGTVDYAQTVTNYSGGIIECLAPGTLVIETAGTLHNNLGATLRSQPGGFIRIRGLVNNYGIIDAQ